MLNDKFVGVLNGVIGDHLHQSKNPLSIEMGFYHKLNPIGLDLSVIKKDYPKSSNTVCVFIHGSAASETNWVKKDKVNYSESLYNSYQTLPLFLRYNSGLHISENGQKLNDLLQHLIQENSIDEIIIVGHSMGGLIFRSATYYAQLSNNKWLTKIKHAFYIGSPHHGAPLEKFGALTQSILDKIPSPYTKAVNKLVNIRSNGVKDLRHGYLTDEEWQADQLDQFPKNRKTAYPIEKSIEQYVVAATVAEDPDSLLADWFGDIMVRKNSALGKSNRSDLHLEFNPENVLIIGKTAHVPLMYNQDVNDFIVGKLSKSFGTK